MARRHGLTRSGCFVRKKRRPRVLGKQISILSAVPQVRSSPVKLQKSCSSQREPLTRPLLCRPEDPAYVNDDERYRRLEIGYSSFLLHELPVLKTTDHACTLGLDLRLLCFENFPSKL